MKRVFADTSFYQALFHQHDAYHHSATQILKGLSCTIITTEYVLVELGALMSCGKARQLFFRFVESIPRSPSTEVVSTSSELFEKGLELFSKRPDKEWSLTDCTSFVLMDQLGITDALTADHHFEQAGFQVLLKR